MLRRSFAGTLLLLAVAVAALPATAAPRTLVHTRATGETSAFSILMEASVPTQGDMSASTTVLERAVSVEGDGFHAETHQSVNGQGFPSSESTATYRVSGSGEISQLASGQLDDPVHGAYVRNLALLYVPLPDGPADTGAEWSAVRTLFTPKMDTPVQLPPIKLAIKLKLEAFETSGDRQIARIAVEAKEAPGQSTQASFTGNYRFDADAGRVVSGSLTGTLKVKVLFSRITVPISVQISESELEVFAD